MKDFYIQPKMPQKGLKRLKCSIFVPKKYCRHNLKPQQRLKLELKFLRFEFPSTNVQKCDNSKFPGFQLYTNRFLAQTSLP